MTWTKLSDDYGDETWDLSDEAFRLMTEMLLFSNRKLLDLVIPKDEMRRFAKHPDAAVELVDGGWIDDVGDAYVIVFHGDYQPRRESVVRKREAAIENGKKGGRPPKPGRPRRPVKTQSLTQNETQRDGTGSLDEVTTSTSRGSSGEPREEPKSVSDWVSAGEVNENTGEVVDVVPASRFETVVDPATGARKRRRVA